jgi:hypothetical protein
MMDLLFKMGSNSGEDNGGILKNQIKKKLKKDVFFNTGAKPQ